jgi:hypothetical protein
MLCDSFSFAVDLNVAQMKSLFFVENFNPSYKQFHPWFLLKGDNKSPDPPIIIFSFVYSFGQSKMFSDAYFPSERIFALDK